MLTQRPGLTGAFVCRPAAPARKRRWRVRWMEDMCGIAGQFNSSGAPVTRELVEQMCIGLEHRGPDSRGMLVEGPVGLGIQRLRVVDLVTGDQPIRNEDGTIAVVLNGEIYNFQELREDLSRRGHRLSTVGDTEVIVHLYEEYGVDCVRHLHGMFAFALWDSRRHQLLLARDRIGKKPLLYSLHRGELSFASEMGALLQNPDIPREIDLESIDAYLAYGYVPAPRSILRAVHKLPPAHTLVVRDGQATVERYWSLDYSSKLEVSDPRELYEPIRDQIRAATRRRLISDVPLGAFLSGGIDSSAVVAAMAEAGGGPVKTFSIGFENAAYDELPHARRIAQLFGTDHHEFIVAPQAIEIVPKMVRHYGEPFADSSAIPSFQLSELARRHVTVALNGDGGDESFGGYTRYVANRLAGRMDMVPESMRRAVAAGALRAVGGAASGGVAGRETSLANKVRRLAAGLPLAPAERYARYVSLFDGTQRLGLYTTEFAHSVRGADALGVIDAAWRSASGSHVVDRMLEVDATTYLPGDLITKIDIATMAHALEARSPLLDHQLMEFAARIPAELKVNGRQKKWIMRQALRGWLPDEILDRPKQGFSVPVGDWFRGDLREHVREVLLDPATLDRGYFEPAAVRAIVDRQASGFDTDSKRVWALFMLEQWHRQFADGKPGAAMRAGDTELATAA
jgi:asparagine synthase (glutamine-hydrolysing)